ncbi:MAG: polyribonucleotide nucleotidyltransferase, polyribonucleotide nucleotidyltransferase [Parcubacteria group bacterium GW2011_GWC1_43_12]|nr:MAG: polyribonucleotide nucleotidyltransferase, polyribonucleotide nucleotidyltransferase [Parcubacteria group bacterium GW2011_GWC1_43_12]
MEKKIFSFDFKGRPLKIEIGRLAQQASGSVLLSYGDSVVLATAVMGKRDKADCNYMPLSVEFEEKLYAAGKIKGSRFIKREGRPQDEAILSGRLIDRTLRPRFDQRIRRDIQIVVSVLSFDKENDPDVLGITAASLALSISDIPWQGPIAAVRVSKMDGQYVVNPTYSEREISSLEIVVSGTEDKVNMLEAGAKETSEEEMVEAIKIGQDAYRELIEFQKEVIDSVSPKKAAVELKEADPAFKKKVEEFIAGKLEPAIYIKDKSTQVGELRQINDSLIKMVKETETENIQEKIFLAADIVEKETDRIVHKNILEKDLRPDERKLNEVREITCEAGILPRTHGSALFSRGATQALSTVTLGAPSEKQIIDGLEAEYKKRFLHHYNFPPFSVGETGPFRGPGRREIGHGALAERALSMLIPPEEEFPYTIRLVSEILSSNGSSSMASVCGSSLALMDAGVPIKAAVAGIAMGLIADEKNPENCKILTDIQGPEDHYGDMDCKVAGTLTGICAIQMDVKIEGVTPEILGRVFQQAKEARTFILQKMNAVINQPRESLSPFAPRIIIFQINPEKIREVIGPGGKIINQIIDETGVKIDIEDSGMIFITSENQESAQKALEWIKNITHEVKIGEVFQGRVTRIINFGAFVEILPGQEGLVHISELAPYRVRKVDDIVKVGDIIPVKVKNIDDQGRINLSLKEASN